MKGLAAIVFMCLAGVAGFALFHITYKVEQLETQLSKLNKEILLEQNAVHVLKAEWSFISRPERISELHRKMLPDLHPLQTRQIGDLDSLPSRSDHLNPLQSNTPAGARLPTLPYRATPALPMTKQPLSAQPVSAQPVSAQPISAKAPG